MRKIYTILTADGPRFAAFHWERDIFFTPAYMHLKDAAAAFGWSNEDACEDAARYVLDMRPDRIRQADAAIGQLEKGQTLNDGDAYAVDCMHDFLHATIAPHQRRIDSLGEELLECWVRELRLRAGRMAEWELDWIVNDGALWSAVHRPSLELKYPDFPHTEPRESPTIGQNMLAGRYMRALACAGKLLGAERSSPEEIVAAWAGPNREKALGPSLLAQVAKLLSDAPGWEITAVQPNIMWPSSS